MKQAAFISNLDGTRSPTCAKLALTMLMPYLTLWLMHSRGTVEFRSAKTSGRSSHRSQWKHRRSVEIGEHSGGRVVRVREKGCGNALRTGIEGRKEPGL